MGLTRVAASLSVSACLLWSAPASSVRATPDTPDKPQSAVIDFTGVETYTGEFWVSLCTQDEIAARNRREGSRCAFEAKVVAAPDAAIAFDDVPEGDYAVTAFHDENGNGALDFDEYGIPLEATGNSRGAEGEYGPPTFEQMQTRIAQGEASRFTIRFYKVQADF